MLKPALMLAKIVWKGAQGVALTGELDQVLQIRNLVWQARQPHTTHVQHLELLQGAEMAWQLLQGVTAARHRHCCSP